MGSVVEDNPQTRKRVASSHNRVPRQPTLHSTSSSSKALVSPLLMSTPTASTSTAKDAPSSLSLTPAVMVSLSLSALALG
jgi:hypothetical protein